MLSNLHTHSTFCDGKNTPRQIVTRAIEKGFVSIGFSGHGYTDFDLRYCMKDTDGFIAQINSLKETFKKDIQIYLGAEEDAFQPVDRRRFDYIVGSSHYFHIGEAFLPIDSGPDYFKKCLAAFGYDTRLLAQTYYQTFCAYIKKRRPDIVGHFDLITKFDEMDQPLFLLDDAYNRLAEKYVAIAAESRCIFELNTGAISRGFRTGAYPAENLLHILKKQGARITLSSDSHQIDTLDYGFDDAKHLLRSIGFRQLYVLYNNEFVKCAI